ncbi:MAG: thymidine phosphorylase [Endomicrobia bacterium]|nr:thymidine phosphorylase [Endomicrobiia bacterium]MCL2798712.1 thymidine phosphorylase [Endomicrobiia bacterium]
MRAYDIIYKKRNRAQLSKQEIEFLVYRYNNGEIPDYQMSAFLMAVCFAGMTDEEIFNLTCAMANSGDILDLSRFDAPTADKHSTGGVGDGTSLIVAPVVASAGIYVPMMVGRGLGHTGGTLDKLESIPGFRTSADKEEFLGFLKYAGAALTGQTNEIAPVDKKMYALRDATATVESIPLICSSIMSKKIAEGAQTLVLDVKTGAGAFMKSQKDALELAEKMIAAGKKFGRNVSAFITDMDTPLGNCAGNSLEIAQAVEILKGNLRNDLSELSLELSAAMIFNSKTTASLDQSRDIAEKQISNGKALEKFRQIVKMQGGNPEVLDNPDKILPKAKNSVKIKSAKTGYVSYMKTRDIGIAVMMTGAGREKKEDKIDYGAGAVFYKKTGDYVKEGEIVSELLYNDASLIEEASSIMRDSYIISEEKTERPKLIKEILN